MAGSQWSYDPGRQTVRTHLREPAWTGNGNVVDVEIVLGAAQPRPEAPEQAITPAQAAALVALTERVDVLRGRIAEAMRAWWDARPEPFRAREESVWERARAAVAHRRAQDAAAAAEHGLPIPQRSDAPTPWDVGLREAEIAHHEPGEPALVRLVLGRSLGSFVTVQVTLRGNTVLRVDDGKSAWGDAVSHAPFVRTPPPADPAAAPRPLPAPAAPIAGAGPAEGHRAWRYDEEANVLHGELALPGWNAQEPTVPLRIQLDDDALTAWREEAAAAAHARVVSPLWQAFRQEMEASGRAAVDAARMDALLADVDARIGPRVDFGAFITGPQREALERFASRRDAVRAEVLGRITALRDAIEPEVRASQTTRRQQLHEAGNAIRRVREEVTGAPPSADAPFEEDDRCDVHRASLGLAGADGIAEIVLHARLEGGLTRDVRVRIRGDAVRID